MNMRRLIYGGCISCFSIKSHRASTCVRDVTFWRLTYKKWMNINKNNKKKVYNKMSVCGKCQQPPCSKINNIETGLAHKFSHYLCFICNIYDRVRGSSELYAQ